MCEDGRAAIDELKDTEHAKGIYVGDNRREDFDDISARRIVGVGEQICGGDVVNNPDPRSGT